MKKRTDEEKREMIDKACDLFNEANEKIMEAKRLMSICGIELCYGFIEGNAYEELHERNLCIHRGIKRLEKLTGSEVHYLTEKPDLSLMSIKYKGLVFSQLGKWKTATKKKFTFR